MAHVLLLTNTLAPSAEVLPALALLNHHVRTLPAEASALVDAPDVSLLLVDARRELAAAKSLCRVIDATGRSCPFIAVVTEGGLAAISAAVAGLLVGAKLADRTAKAWGMPLEAELRK